MIVIDPVGEQTALPERIRYPGSYQLPVIIPPSPPGTERPPPRKQERSSLWFWALLAGAVGLVYHLSDSPDSSLGYFITPLERKRGQKMMYLWKQYGRYGPAYTYGKPKTVSKGNIDYFKQRSGKEGDLYATFAFTADHAREMIKAGAVEPFREGHQVPEILTEQRQAREEKRRSVETHPELPKLPEFWFWKTWGGQKLEYLTDETVEGDPEFYYGAEERKRGRLYKAVGIDRFDAFKELAKRLRKTREAEKIYGKSGGRSHRPFRWTVDDRQGRRIGWYRYANETAEHYNKREAEAQTGRPFVSKAATAPKRALTKAQKRRADEKTAIQAERSRQKGKGEAAIEAKIREFIEEGEEFLEKVSKKKPTTAKPPAEQLTFFSGRIANCAYWLEDGGGWYCAGYARACDPPACADPPEPKIREKVCVEDQQVHSPFLKKMITRCKRYGRPEPGAEAPARAKQIKVCVEHQQVRSGFLKKMVSRCKRYDTACAGAACMPEPMPYPGAPEKGREPSSDEVKELATWIAEQYNEETFGGEPVFAREILDRGGIAPYRKGYMKEEYASIPLFLKNKRGMAMDQIAAEMGVGTDVDLMRLIEKAYPAKTKGKGKSFLKRKTWRDFKEDAYERLVEGTAYAEWEGLLGGGLGYDKADINSAINAALRSPSSRKQYIFPTYYGFKLSHKKEFPGSLNHIVVHPNGDVVRVVHNVRTGQATEEVIGRKGRPTATTPAERGELFGLGAAPEYVWRSTIEEFTALPRTTDDPALPSQLNWILKRTKQNEDGLLRIFRGNLPSHMERKLQEWLWRMYREPGKLPDQRVKVVFNDDRTADRYNIIHPYYQVTVTFYDTGGVQVSESRNNYHGDSVRAAIIAGKPVPKKVLQEYAPYIPEAKAALGFGQDLFPQLRRELVLEEPQDIATSDDPVMACMQRLGWKLPRMIELKESIGEKMTPDLFTGKTQKLSSAEKEYQRVMAECLAARSGTAGLLGARRRHYYLPLLEPGPMTEEQRVTQSMESRISQKMRERNVQGPIPQPVMDALEKFKKTAYNLSHREGPGDYYQKRDRFNTAYRALERQIEAIGPEPEQMRFLGQRRYALAAH